MVISHCTEKEIRESLEKVNRLFNNNIKFRRIDQIGNNRYRVTLTVHDSQGIGGRIGHTGRAISSACWHIYGIFFDSLPESAMITVSDGKRNRTIRAINHGWKDRNIGSIVHPMQYSDACTCRNFDQYSEIRERQHISMQRMKDR